jgi:hypothetical protein
MDSLLWAEAIPEDAKEAPQGLKPEEEIARFTVCASLGRMLLSGCLASRSQL